MPKAINPLGRKLPTIKENISEVNKDTSPQTIKEKANKDISAINNLIRRATKYKELIVENEDSE